MSEQWTFGSIEPETVILKSGAGMCVVHRPHSAVEFTHEQLERIIACFNFCDGIPTDRLMSVVEVAERANCQPLAALIAELAGVVSGTPIVRAKMFCEDTAR